MYLSEIKNNDNNQNSLKALSSKGFKGNAGFLGNTAKSASQEGEQLSVKTTQKTTISNPSTKLSSVVKVDNDKQRERKRKYSLQSKIRNIYIAEGKKRGLKYVTDYHRTAHCKHSISNNGIVQIWLGQGFKRDTTNAYYTGLQTCGSVWTCPVCAARIQEQRREEIAKAINYKYEHGKQAVMITFTFPHYKQDNLKDLLKKQAKALKYFKSGAGFVKFKSSVGFAGLIRSLEITYSTANGWHPHTHELFFVDKGVDKKEFESFVLMRWLDSCKKAGLVTEEQEDDFLAHSIRIIFECRASDYLAKYDSSKNWGIDREIAKASSKHGKKSGYHPFRLADEGMIEQFIEYTDAIKGKAQLFWSRGLKDEVGITDVEDGDIAEAEVQEEDRLIVTIDSIDWLYIIRELDMRSELLDLAEEGRNADYFFSILDEIDRKHRLRPWSRETKTYAAPWEIKKSNIR